MKAGERKYVTLSQTGQREFTRTRYEQDFPGAVFFDVTIQGLAAKGKETPFSLTVATPEYLGVPNDFYYEVTVSQGNADLGRFESSRGIRASLKKNLVVDSARPVSVKIFCPASWQRQIRVLGVPVYKVWEPQLWVQLQAKHQQGG